MRNLKCIIIIFFCLSTVSSAIQAQQLSKAGHIAKSEQSRKIKQEIRTDGQVFLGPHAFLGNQVWKFQDHFLSLEANYENAPAVLHYYSVEANRLWSREFKRAANLQSTADGKVIAFLDADSIVLFDLVQQSLQKYPQTYAFALDEEGQLAQYIEEFGEVWYKGLRRKAPQAIHKIVFHQGDCYLISRNTLWKLEADSLRSIFSTGKVLFDVASIDEKLWLSLRSKSQDGYVFELREFKNNQLDPAQQSTFYQTRSSIVPTTGKLPAEGHRSNELIRNPMDWFSDTSYQQVGNTYNEIQEYSPGAVYLHPGVDLFGEHLENVHSVKGGFVRAILTTSADYHWRVAIANENTSDSSQGYLYAHLDQNLIPLLVGDTVTEGEVIGQLVDFPVTGFVHCHFARIVDEGFTWFGNWWTFDDPLFYMSNFKDTTAPVFTPFDNGELLRFKNPVTSSFYPKNAIDWNENPDFIVKVHDQVNTDWQVDIHSTGYVLLKLNYEAGVWVEADTMQNVKSFDFNYFNDTYFSGPYIQTLISTMYNRDDSFFSSGNYQVRDFYHVLSNSNGDDTLDVQDAAVSLQTASLPSGKYRIKVWAKDAAGNISWANHDFSKGTVGLHHDGQQNFTAFPNPTDGSITLINQNSNCDFSLYDVTGRLIQSGELLKGINRLNLPPTAGLYLLHTQFGTVRILRKD